MKLDTFVLISKLAAYTLLGGLTPMGTALQQWLNTGDWPPRINWVGIFIGAGIGACTNYLAFFSSAWATWKGQRSNGGVDNPPKPVSTTTP